MNRKILVALLCAAAFAGACGKEEPPPLYEPQPVARRDITVSAEAAGTIEPILVVDVKSKASGEIIELTAETGDEVRQGELLIRVDPREPQNAVAQAEADLEVARAQLATAEANKRRADQMFASQLISEQEHQNAQLQFANARAQLVRAERTLENARDQLEDTNVRAPISGVIIQKNVERGQVIASATREVSGGTVLLRMADLAEVQVRTLVDETDIGKIRAGLRATITVDAYPNQPFQGSVLKIEPQSVSQQNVTMFPVIIRIANPEGRLRPGMSASVEIHVEQRRGVLAIPNAALRTPRDVASAAQVLGLNPVDVQQELARADSIAARNPQRAQSAQGGRSDTGASFSGRTEGPATQGQAPGPQPAQAQPAQSPQARQSPAPQQTGAMQGRPGGPGGFQFSLPEGVSQEMATEIRRKRQAGEPLSPAESTAAVRMREHFQRLREQGGGQVAGAQSGGQGGGQVGAGQSGGQGGGFQLPPGVTQEQMRAIFNKLRNGQTLTPAEQAIMTRMRSQAASQGGARRRFGANSNFMFGGSYIVFVLRNGRPTPVRVRTGVTDLDYSEVVSGLTEQDTVLLLPSASLVQAQQEMRERFQRMGGGGVPGMQQQPQAGGRR
ncbi:MAG TPA: efflux RND transporter periplasmic adaptor subunit [Gemmatimonadales bacterium]|nr:efflux RND transporter periplasmic adaptor subunit [Gemmatimonadales bacterium]